MSATRDDSDDDDDQSVTVDPCPWADDSHSTAAHIASLSARIRRAKFGCVTIRSISISGSSYPVRHIALSRSYNAELNKAQLTRRNLKALLVS